VTARSSGASTGDLVNAWSAAARVGVVVAGARPSAEQREPGDGPTRPPVLHRWPGWAPTAAGPNPRRPYRAGVMRP